MSFSQHPGFAEFFASLGPRDAEPSHADQALLRRHRPRIFLPPDHPGAIGFYEDYVAQGTLHGPDGTVIRDRVTQDLLNAHKHDPHVAFHHRPEQRPQTPVVFGRIARDTLYVPEPAGASTAIPLTFLTYNVVFRHSGLPAGLPWWQLRLADVLSARLDWHQLDHYTAVTLVIDRQETPLALQFQQHNYLRTYVIGTELELPADRRPLVDVAIGSNELYPHSPERTRRRAASFLSAKTVAFLLAGTEPPRLCGDDITHGVDELDYRLDCLPPGDAVYAFKGRLGVRRRLPGRSGPPGADYNTLPAFKPPALQLIAFYWHEHHQDYVALVKEGLFHDPGGRFRRSVPQDLYHRLAERFGRALRAAAP